MNVKGNIEIDEDKMAVACYNEIKKMYSKDYSECVSIFGGMHMSRIIGKTGEILSMRPEPFYVLDLPIPTTINEPTLKQCLDLYCEKESLVGENAWYNEKTKKKEDVDKQVVFWSLPKIMIITLKRFTATGHKIQKSIDIPIDNFDLSEYVYGYDKESYKYELYGICNHMGGTLGGHYTAFVKHTSDKWFICNDTIVKEVNISHALNKNYAYCLFFRKK